jgi:hypothetical protein
MFIEKAYEDINVLFLNCRVSVCLSLQVQDKTGSRVCRQNAIFLLSAYLGTSSSQALTQSIIKPYLASGKDTHNPRDEGPR